METFAQTLGVDRVGSARLASATLIAAMALFTATWLLLGFVNDGYVLYDIVIEEYSVVSQPISGLGLGSTATAMNAAFVLYGAVAMCGAVGVGKLLGRIDPAVRRPAIIALGLHGLGSIVVGLFTLESVELHSVGFLCVLAPIVGFVFIGRRLSEHPLWRSFARSLTRIAVPISIVLVVTYLVSFDPIAAGEGRGIAGLTQRALVLHLQAWMGALIIASWRRSQPADVAARLDEVRRSPRNSSCSSLPLWP